MQDNAGNTAVGGQVPQIDLKDVVNDKKEGLYEKLPGFLKRYLRKITHVDEINRLLRKAHGKDGLEFSKMLMEEFDVKVTATGTENIHQSKRIIIVGNHPLGGFDGMTLFYILRSMREDILIPANDFLMNLENLKPHFIPVNKIGSNSANVRRLEMAFRSDSAIQIFPAGICSRKSNGVICDLEWKKTFITKARSTQRDIVPVFISGQNSKRFYRLAQVRKFFRIGFNIEMMYLVDEAYRLKDKHIKMIFGKPIPYTTFDKRFRDVEWAQKVKDYVYTLPQNPEAVFSVE